MKSKILLSYSIDTKENTHSIVECQEYKQISWITLIKGTM